MTKLSARFSNELSLNFSSGAFFVAHSRHDSSRKID
jgi:hypothetical protein